MFATTDAVLFGGLADGYAVELDKLHALVTVFQNGGAPFAVEGDQALSHHPGARRLGLYELVEPIGPERPVYLGLRP
jgi:hypothetical protein